MSDREQLIRTVLDSPLVRGYMKRHSEVESAPRWTCPECQFESNTHYENHERTCSQRKAVAS